MDDYERTLRRIDVISTMNYVKIKDSDRSVVYKAQSENKSYICKLYLTDNVEYTAYKRIDPYRICRKAGTCDGIKYVILKDLSKLYSPINDWMIPCDERKMNRIIVQVARFHGICTSVGSSSDPIIKRDTPEESRKKYKEYLEFIERDYNVFIENHNQNSINDWKHVYSNALKYLHQNAWSAATYMERYGLIHGDLNTRNVYYPTTEFGDPVILDYEALKYGLPANDLIMLLIHDLYHGFDTTTHYFKYYYEQIMKYRNHYTKDDFRDDIVLSVYEGLFFPMKLYTHYGIEDDELIHKSLDYCINMNMNLSTFCS